MNITVASSYQPTLLDSGVNWHTDGRRTSTNGTRNSLMLTTTCCSASFLPRITSISSHCCTCLDLEYALLEAPQRITLIRSIGMLAPRLLQRWSRGRPPQRFADTSTLRMTPRVNPGEKLCSTVSICLYIADSDTHLAVTAINALLNLAE